MYTLNCKLQKLFNFYSLQCNEVQDQVFSMQALQIHSSKSSLSVYSAHDLNNINLKILLGVIWMLYKANIHVLVSRYKYNFPHFFPPNVPFSYSLNVSLFLIFFSGFF